MDANGRETFPRKLSARVGTRQARRYAVGAELITPDECSFRVWAPAQRSLQLWLDGRVSPMTSESGGYFSLEAKAHQGSRYAFVMQDDERLYPDPASRWQPEGPEGQSSVVELGDFPWTDEDWDGCELRGQVLYEMHIGTFTAEGTWRAAANELQRLRDIGITTVQVMPVGEFAGEYGWGYDGVDWFAPMHTYGAPGDLQYFVDSAHRLGMGVVLDVVYNHLGPSGNFLRRFSKDYFTSRHVTEWGDAVNFDGDGSGPVREFVLANVRYWIQEFHFDGLRLDAAQALFDDGETHIMSLIAKEARAAASPRSVFLLAEHEPQHARIMRDPHDGGYGLDGIYNEDFHHTMRVAMTGMREAYLSDYRGTSDEWLNTVQWGFLFQGQYYPWQDNPRGAPALDRAPHQFVCFLENHDQVANSALGRRLIDLTSPAWWRAISSLLLLGPWTPLLFQGQERGSRTRFQYFVDHRAELQQAVFDGRREFLEQFSRLIGDIDELATLEDIGRRAFDRSRPAGEASADNAVTRLYRDALSLRADDGTLGQRAQRIGGATIGDRTMLLRFIGSTPAADRLLVVNLAADLNLAPLPQPLVAPPEGHDWEPIFCSEDRRYDGCGIAASEPPLTLVATGHATTVFKPTLSSDPLAEE